MYENRIIRTPELLEITGLSRTTIWRLEKKGFFDMIKGLVFGSKSIKDNVQEDEPQRKHGLRRMSDHPGESLRGGLKNL